MATVLLYFFRYKTEFFPFQNNPQNLDPFYKTDLDLWDRLGMVKLVQLFVVILEREKNPVL